MLAEFDAFPCRVESKKIRIGRHQCSIIIGTSNGDLDGTSVNTENLENRMGYFSGDIGRIDQSGIAFSHVLTKENVLQLTANCQLTETVGPEVRVIGIRWILIARCSFSMPKDLSSS